MNVLLLTSHSIAEYDDLRMLSDLGYSVFSIGAYTDPANPGDDMRPALPNVKAFPELAAKCIEQREKHATEDASFVIDWAKGDLHPDIIDWADAIIVHHFPIPWIVAQWGRLKHKRVIWRTCGQSNPELEQIMSRLRPTLQVVRYSPAERRYFERVGSFAGEDALIRFGKYPDDYGPWTGEDAVVGNVTQNMASRGDHCGLSFWLVATDGLRARPAGPGSDSLPGGIGALSYDEMREYLSHCRAYLYTGTVPASYTLGLIEAMLTGVPVVSIGPNAWHGPAELFEGHEIVGGTAYDPAARDKLARLLTDEREAKRWSVTQRDRARHLFGIDKIGRQWVDFLGSPGERADIGDVTWQTGQPVTVTA